jgi:PAS domain S-box-containing protein
MTTIAERYASFKRLIAQAIISPVVILLVLAGLLAWQIEQLVSEAHWVDHTDQVIAQAYRTQRIALQAQTGLRGYLLSREQRYLDPFNQAQQNIGPAFNKLHGLVTDNPPQVYRVQFMEGTYAAWYAAAQQQIAKKREGPTYFQQEFIRSQGRSPIDSLLNQFEQFISVEEQLRERRVEKEQSTTNGVLASALFLALASGLILGLLTARRMSQVSSEYEHVLSLAQRSSEMLATTLLSIGDGVLVTDQNGRITHINSVAEQISGWKVADAVGKDAKEVFRIINETTRQPVESPIDRVIREGVIVGLANHTVLVRRDGSEVPIDDSGAPIRDEEGKLIGVVLVFRDISERRRSEQAKYHLAAIVESSDDAIISKDLNGVITSWNRGAERLFGYTAEEVIGQPILILYPPDRPNEMHQILEQIKSGERVEHFETIRRSKSGKLIDVSLTVSPVLDAGGQITGASKIARDITEKKRAEEQFTQEYEKQHRIAEALQNSLLIEPEADAFPHIETRTLYRAARQEAKVGGDYYDVFAPEDNKVALIVGDVSGKGLDAAAKTAELKYILRGYMREHPHAMTGITRLNAFICDALALDSHPEPYFLCLTIVVIDPLSRIAEVCVGGAESPLILRGNGEVEQAAVTGMPLGVDPKAEYKPIQIEMGEQDVLILTTDGLTEARRGKEFLGIDGLTRLVKACGAFSQLESLENCILNGAEEFAEGGFSDDVCMLLVRAGR